MRRCLPSPIPKQTGNEPQPREEIGFVFTDRAPLDPRTGETTKSKCRTVEGVTLRLPNPSAERDLQRSFEQNVLHQFPRTCRIQTPSSSLPLPLLLLRHTYPNCQIIMTSSFRRTFAHLFRSYSLVFHLFFRFNQNYCKWRVLGPPSPSSHSSPSIPSQFQHQLCVRAFDVTDVRAVACRVV